MGINKFLGIVWSGIAIVLLVILIMAINGKKGNFWRLNRNKSVELGTLYSTDIFDADKIDELDVTLVSESFVLKPHNEDVVKVELYCNELTAPTIDLNSSSLTIQSSKKKINVGMMNRKVIVYVPYNKKFARASIALVSGAMHLTDFDCDTFESNSVSGSSNFENCNFGNIVTQQISGSLNIRNSTGKNIETKCASGSIHITGSFDGLDLKSTSGSVHVTLDKPLEKDSAVESTSGSIHLGFPKNSNLKIEHKSTGSYRNSITGTTGKNGTDIMGSGDVKLYLKATSGSIHID